VSAPGPRHPAAEPADSSTRSRLLQAARELVEESGYGAASVLAVTERAGVAAGTLYRHFASKEELFVELFRTVCDRDLAAMEAAADPGGSALTQLTQVVDTFAQRALRRPRLAWALLAEPGDRLVDAERLAYRRRYAALLRHRLDAAVADGEAPAQDTELTAAALVGGCAEALVGPLAEGAGTQRTLTALRAFVLRAVGAGAMPSEAAAA
jgi:AcrR family transcriptional regulator